MDPKTKNSAEYLKTKVLTASPEQLQLMLYDGAIRFCEQARAAIENKQIETSFNLLNKAERIVMELCTSMREDFAPELCFNMRRLYLFCYDRLVTANVNKDLKAVDESLDILRHLRQTWLLLMEKIHQEKSAASPSAAPAPDDLLSQQLGATLSLQG